MRSEIRTQYFDWLTNLVTRNRVSKQVSYNKLLNHLHDTKFRYSIPLDRNRASDGVDLRYRFASKLGYSPNDARVGPCTVLEMMVALSIRCEESIMDDPAIGDRVGQWFWNMIASLGLGGLYDTRYDPDYVDDILDIFLNRDYNPDGSGGLFTIRYCDVDLRDVQIWTQMLWYLDTIVDDS